METSFDSSSTPLRRKGHRLWMPVGIVLLAIAGLAVIQTRPDMEHNFKGWFSGMVVVLAGFLMVLWFLFFSRFNGRMRLISAGILVLVGIGLKQTLRVDGTIDGSGRPKFVWRWTPTHKVDFNATSVPVAKEGIAPPVVVPDAVDVPQYFGPHRDGMITDGKLAHDWTAQQPKQLWRHPVGAGWSAFAVVGGRAYTQEQRGENEVITCYDLLTGTQLWLHSNTAHFTQWQGGEGPRATPTVDQGRVFTMGATGILDCLEADTGKLIWSRQVLEENKLKNIIWGISDSPLVFDDTVIVTGGFSDPKADGIEPHATVIAYRRSDGTPLWQSGKDNASYASPILATLAGKRVVLSFNAASLTIHDAKTGDVLLDHPFTDAKWPKASQPVVLDGDRVFISAGYGAGCEMLQIKTSADGKLTATELWKNLRMRTQFNSVTARQGFLYGLDDGMMACLDIATGDRKWKEGRFGSGQTLLVDDLAIIQSEPGPVILAEAKPDGYKELGRIPALSVKTWNHPTLAGRYLLVRNNEEMACYELPVRGAETKTAGR